MPFDFTDPAYRKILVFEKLDRAFRLATGKMSAIQIVELSNDLRMLLAQGHRNLFALWHEAGFEDEIILPFPIIRERMKRPSPRVEPRLAEHDHYDAIINLGMFNDYIMIAQSRMCRRGNEYITDAEIRQSSTCLWERLWDDAFDNLSLNKYLSSPMIIFNDNSISTETVIKYCANKVGGAHIDLKRSDKEVDYLSLDTLVKDYTKLSERAPHDPNNPSLTLANRIFSNYVLSCIPAICQHLFRSRSIKKLYQWLHDECCELGMPSRPTPYRDDILFHIRLR